MPAIEVIPEPKWGQRMSVQHAAVGSSGLVGTAAAVLWLVLLVTGVHGMWKSWRTSSLVPALAVTTLGQCGVYLCYGEETFLYALQVAPLLVVCAAHGPTAGRRWPILIAALLVALLALNNLVALDSALRFFDGSLPVGPVPR
jgi:hypothetical protein